ncbi:DEAD/DEAH box helicase [Helicobacter himalayensis]|uniref:DEAD/DEAH box helicase n=1 Tax=Helicobacter himalayensis TaxID=1591088 RepID=UPI003D6ECBA6
MTHLLLQKADLNNPCFSLTPKELDSARKVGIFTLYDIGLNPPKNYEQKNLLQTLSVFEKQNALECALRVEITQCNKAGFGKKMYLRLSAYSLEFDVPINLVIFNPKPFVYSAFGVGKQCVIYGKLERKFSQYSMVQPKILNQSAIENLGKITLQFKAKDSKNLRAVMDLLVQKVYNLENLLACGVSEAHARELLRIFQPDDAFVGEFRQNGGFSAQSLGALKFNEILRYMLILRSKRLESRANFVCNGEYESFINALPFSLTKGQRNAIDTIAKDLNSQKAARRLIMGDVGCGKTIVILSAVMMAYPRKSVLLAPTSVLAKQLYEEARKFLPESVKVKLVLGSNKEFTQGTLEQEGLESSAQEDLFAFALQDFQNMSQNPHNLSPQKNAEYEHKGDTIDGIDSNRPNSGTESTNQKSLKNAEYAREAEPSGIHFRKGDTIDGIDSCHFIIGTQALLYRNLNFDDCALVMSDEQHRFGTNQRYKLEKMFSAQNGVNPSKPHSLQFSATPIPRTMAMINSQYINVSNITDLPFKKDITTSIIGKSAFKGLIAHLQSEFALFHQAIIVYPLVEESEHINYLSLNEGREFWQRHFEGVYVTSGKDKQKERVLEEFKEKGNLLLATTLIEVGISLPRLSTIIIVAPERLGLATLHQLRGRVSRNGLKGYCFLYTHTTNTERLEKFASTLDGFKIAELDLKYRNSGDLLSGTRQSGDEFVFFSYEDSEILSEAKSAIEKVES